MLISIILIVDMMVMMTIIEIIMMIRIKIIINDHTNLYLLTSCTIIKSPQLPIYSTIASVNASINTNNNNSSTKTIVLNKCNTKAK